MFLFPRVGVTIPTQNPVADIYPESMCLTAIIGRATVARIANSGVA